MNDNCYSVYKHTSPSGKAYIGITKQKPERRWRDGKGYRPCSNRISAFWYAIQKYGWENFSHEIVFQNLSHDEACELEKKLIKELKTDQPEYGYNILKGGNVPLFECPEAVRLHMKESAFIKWNAPEYIEMHTGENHWTHKKGYSQKSIDAMRKANIGKKKTPEQIEFLREKGRKQKRFYGRDNKTSRPVICMSLDGTEIAHYGGMSEAARITGVTFQGISKVCKGIQKTAGGYYWKYEEQGV